MIDQAPERKRGHFAARLPLGFTKHHPGSTKSVP